MGAVKAIVRRPWIHHFIIWGYILAPIANIVLVSLFLHVPVATVVQRLFRGYGPLATLWLLTAPIVGVSLYFVGRATWYLFLGHGSLVFVDFVIKWVARPVVMLHTIPPLNNLLILGGNFILVALIGYVIQRDFRAPYFQALQRSFREHKRVPIRHNIMLNGVQARIDDLSITGCFVAGTHPYQVGKEVTVSFRSETLKLTVKGQVMRETAYGLGIRFLSVTGREKRDIARLLKNRYTLRYKTDLPAKWSVNHTGHQGRLFDVSATGCFLATDVQGLQPAAAASIAVGVGSTDIVARGRIVWVNVNGEHNKPRGFGLRFNRRQRQMVSLVRRQVGGLEQAR